MISSDAITLKVLEHSQNVKECPFWNDQGNSLDMNPIEYNYEIGNQMPSKKEEMWKRVCEAWYSVALNVLEELYNAISRRIADLIKTKGNDFMM